MRELGPQDRADTADGWHPAEAVPPVPVRPAASVIVLREGGDGPEVFLQHRVSTMDFAAGVAVFPGGRVDQADRGPEVPAGVPEDLLARHARAWRHTDEAGTVDGARMILAAALREVAEETGAALDPLRLMPWANWITPPGRPRRYDTYFFLTAADAALTLEHRTSEAHRSVWTPVRQALEDEERGEVKLMRPTLTLLRELASLGSAEDILAQAATGRRIEPVRHDR